MFNKNRHSLRVVSLVLITTFTISEFSYAAPLLKENLPTEALGVKFNPPLQFCQLKDIHVTNNQTPFLVNIEDPHSNFSGQENLSKTIDQIVRESKIDLILVEGGSKDDSLTQLKKTASRQTWNKVARKFLLEGKIQGEEYLNLTSDHAIKIIGIENKHLYLKSLEAYANLAGRRQEILDYLKMIRRSLNKLKLRHYPKGLLEYEEAKNKSPDNYEARIKKLSALAESVPGMTCDLYPMIQMMRSLLDKEKSIDFHSANLELAAIIEALAKKGGSTEFRDFLKESAGLKNQRISQLAYFQKTLDMANKRHMNLADYSNLTLYTEYLKQFSDINFEKLMEEIEKLEEEVTVKTLRREDADTKREEARFQPRASGLQSVMSSPHALSGDPDTNKKSSWIPAYAGMTDQVRDNTLLIHSIDRYLQLLQAAYSIQMSNKEFRAYILNEPDFSTVSYLAFINSELSKTGDFEDLIVYKKILELGKKSLIEFYDSVEKRDLAFIQNAEDILKREKKDKAILIAGGYHTRHLKKLFKEKNFSYAVLSPIVTSPTSQEKYEKVLLEPLKEIKRSLKLSDEYPKNSDKRQNEVRPLALLESGSRLAEVVREARLWGEATGARLAKRKMPSYFAKQNTRSLQGLRYQIVRNLKKNKQWRSMLADDLGVDEGRVNINFLSVLPGPMKILCAVYYGIGRHRALKTELIRRIKIALNKPSLTRNRFYYLHRKALKTLRERIVSGFDYLKYLKLPQRLRENRPLLQDGRAVLAHDAGITVKDLTEERWRAITPRQRAAIEYYYREDLATKSDVSRALWKDGFRFTRSTKPVADTNLHAYVKRAVAEFKEYANGWERLAHDMGVTVDEAKKKFQELSVSEAFVIVRSYGLGCQRAEDDSVIIAECKDKKILTRSGRVPGKKDIGQWRMKTAKLRFQGKSGPAKDAIEDKNGLDALIEAALNEARSDSTAVKLIEGLAGERKFVAAIDVAKKDEKRRRAFIVAALVTSMVDPPENGQLADFKEEYPSLDQAIRVLRNHDGLREFMLIYHGFMPPNEARFRRELEGQRLDLLIARQNRRQQRLLWNGRRGRRSDVAITEGAVEPAPETTVLQGARLANRSKAARSKKTPRSISRRAILLTSVLAAAGLTLTGWHLFSKADAKTQMARAAKNLVRNFETIRQVNQELNVLLENDLRELEALLRRLARSSDYIEDESVPVLAVVDGQIHLNPENTSDFSTLQFEELLLHEAVHLLKRQLEMANKKKVLADKLNGASITASDEFIRQAKKDVVLALQIEYEAYALELGYVKRSAGVQSLKHYFSGLSSRCKGPAGAAFGHLSETIDEENRIVLDKLILLKLQDPDPSNTLFKQLLSNIYLHEKNPARVDNEHFRQWIIDLFRKENELPRRLPKDTNTSDGARLSDPSRGPYKLGALIAQDPLEASMNLRLLPQGPLLRFIQHLNSKGIDDVIVGGGALRDALLGQEPKDIDFMVRIRLPEPLKASFEVDRKTLSSEELRKKYELNRRAHEVLERVAPLLGVSIRDLRRMKAQFGGQGLEYMFAAYVVDGVMIDASPDSSLSIDQMGVDRHGRLYFTEERDALHDLKRKIIRFQPKRGPQGKIIISVRLKNVIRAFRFKHQYGFGIAEATVGMIQRQLERESSRFLQEKSTIKKRFQTQAKQVWRQMTGSLFSEPPVSFILPHDRPLFWRLRYVLLGDQSIMERVTLGWLRKALDLAPSPQALIGDLERVGLFKNLEARGIQRSQIDKMLSVYTQLGLSPTGNSRSVMGARLAKATRTQKKMLVTQHEVNRDGQLIIKKSDLKRFKGKIPDKLQGQVLRLGSGQAGRKVRLVWGWYPDFEFWVPVGLSRPSPRVPSKIEQVPMITITTGADKGFEVRQICLKADKDTLLKLDQSKDDPVFVRSMFDSRGLRAFSMTTTRGRRDSVVIGSSSGSGEGRSGRYNLKTRAQKLFMTHIILGVPIDINFVGQDAWEPLTIIATPGFMHENLGMSILKIHQSSPNLGSHQMKSIAEKLGMYAILRQMPHTSKKNHLPGIRVNIPTWTDEKGRSQETAVFYFQKECAGQTVVLLADEQGIPFWVSAGRKNIIELDPEQRFLSRLEIRSKARQAPAVYGVYSQVIGPNEISKAFAARGDLEGEVILTRVPVRRHTAHSDNGIIRVAGEDIYIGAYLGQNLPEDVYAEIVFDLKDGRPKPVELRLGTYGSTNPLDPNSRKFNELRNYPIRQTAESERLEAFDPNEAIDKQLIALRYAYLCLKSPPLIALHTLLSDEGLPPSIQTADQIIPAIREHGIDIDRLGTDYKHWRDIEGAGSDLLRAYSVYSREALREALQGNPRIGLASRILRVSTHVLDYYIRKKLLELFEIHPNSRIAIAAIDNPDNIPQISESLARTFRKITHGLQAQDYDPAVCEGIQEAILQALREKPAREKQETAAGQLSFFIEMTNRGLIIRSGSEGFDRAAEIFRNDFDKANIEVVTQGARLALFRKINATDALRSASYILWPLALINLYQSILMVVAAPAIINSYWPVMLTGWALAGITLFSTHYQAEAWKQLVILSIGFAVTFSLFHFFVAPFTIANPILFPIALLARFAAVYRAVWGAEQKTAKELQIEPRKFTPMRWSISNALMGGLFINVIFFSAMNKLFATPWQRTVFDLGIGTATCTLWTALIFGAAFGERIDLLKNFSRIKTLVQGYFKIYPINFGYWFVVVFAAWLAAEPFSNPLVRGIVPILVHSIGIYFWTMNFQPFIRKAFLEKDSTGPAARETLESKHIGPGPVTTTTTEKSSTLLIFPPTGFRFPKLSEDLDLSNPQVRFTIDRVNLAARAVLNDADFDVTKPLRTSADGEVFDEDMMRMHLAIMTHQMILFDELKRRHEREWRETPPRIVGFSRGIAAAYYASGALSLEEAVELCIRSTDYVKSCWLKNGYRMGAVTGISKEKLEALLREFKANIAAEFEGEYFSVSAQSGDVEKISAAIKAAGGQWRNTFFHGSSHDPNTTGEDTPEKTVFEKFLATLAKRSATAISLYSGMTPGKEILFPIDIYLEELNSLSHPIPAKEVIETALATIPTSHVWIMGSHYDLGVGASIRRRSHDSKISVQRIASFSDLDKSTTVKVTGARLTQADLLATAQIRLKDDIEELRRLAQKLRAEGRREKLAIVIPMYREMNRMKKIGEHPNAEDFLRGKIGEIQKLLNEYEGVIDWEFIFVDDGCPEGSGRAAEGILQREFPDLYNRKAFVLSILGDEKRKIKSVKGGAVRRGAEFALSTTDAHEAATLILVTDADHSTDLIHTASMLVEAMKSKNRNFFLKGSRRSSRGGIALNRPLFSKIRSRVFIEIVHILLPHLRSIADTQCAFDLMSDQTASLILANTASAPDNGLTFETQWLEEAWWSSIRVKEVGVIWQDSPKESTMSFKRSLQMLFSLWNQRQKWHATGRFPVDMIIYRYAHRFKDAERQFFNRWRMKKSKHSGAIAYEVAQRRRQEPQYLITHKISPRSEVSDVIAQNQRIFMDVLIQKAPALAKELEMVPVDAQEICFARGPALAAESAAKDALNESIKNFPAPSVTLGGLCLIDDGRVVFQVTPHTPKDLSILNGMVDDALDRHDALEDSRIGGLLYYMPAFYFKVDRQLTAKESLAIQLTLAEVNRNTHPVNFDVTEISGRIANRYHGTGDRRDLFAVAFNESDFGKTAAKDRSRAKRKNFIDIAQMAYPASIDDVLRVGPAKPVGYLPVSVIGSELITRQIADWARSKALGTFTARGGIHTKPALYVYDADSLKNLLDENRETLVRAGVSTDPQGFMAHVSTHWVYDPEDQEAAKIVGVAFANPVFGDHPSYLRMMARAQGTLKEGARLAETKPGDLIVPMQTVVGWTAEREPVIGDYDLLWLMGSWSLETAMEAARQWKIYPDKPILITGGIGQGTKTIASLTQENDLSHPRDVEIILITLNRMLDELAALKTRDPAVFWQEISRRFNIKKGLDKEKKAQGDVSGQMTWEEVLNFHEQVFNPELNPTLDIEEFLLDRLLNPSTRNDTLIPEAILYAAILESQGVPREKIMVDAQSTTSRENMKYGQAILEKAGLNPKKVLLIQNPIAQRRGKAAFQKTFPGIQVLSLAGYVPDYQALLTAQGEKIVIMFALFLADEVKRTKKHSASDKIAKVDIPPDVEAAASQLSEMVKELQRRAGARPATKSVGPSQGSSGARLAHAEKSIDRWNRISVSEVKQPASELESVRAFHTLTRFKSWKDIALDDTRLSLIKSYVLEAAKRQKELGLGIEVVNDQIINEALNREDGIYDLIRRAHPYTLRALAENGQPSSAYALHEGAYYTLFARKLLRILEADTVVVNVDPHGDDEAYPARQEITDTGLLAPKITTVPDITDYNWATAAVQDGLAAEVIQIHPAMNGIHRTMTPIRGGKVFIECHHGPEVREKSYASLIDKFIHQKRASILLTFDIDSFSWGDGRGGYYRFSESEIEPLINATCLSPLQRLGMRPFKLVIAESNDYVAPVLRGGPYLKKALTAVGTLFEEMFYPGNTGARFTKNETQRTQLPEFGARLASPLEESSKRAFIIDQIRRFSQLACDIAGHFPKKDIRRYLFWNGMAYKISESLFGLAEKIHIPVSPSSTTGQMVWKLSKIMNRVLTFLMILTIKIDGARRILAIDQYVDGRVGFIQPKPPFGIIVVKLALLVLSIQEEFDSAAFQEALNYLSESPGERMIPNAQADLLIQTVRANLPFGPRELEEIFVRNFIERAGARLAWDSEGKLRRRLEAKSLEIKGKGLNASQVAKIIHANSGLVLKYPELMREFEIVKGSRGKKPASYSEISLRLELKNRIRDLLRENRITLDKLGRAVGTYRNPRAAMFEVLNPEKLNAATSVTLSSILEALNRFISVGKTGTGVLPAVSDVDKAEEISSPEGARLAVTSKPDPKKKPQAERIEFAPISAKPLLALKNPRVRAVFRQILSERLNLGTTAEQFGLSKPPKKYRFAGRELSHRQFVSWLMGFLAKHADEDPAQVARLFWETFNLRGSDKDFGAPRETRDTESEFNRAVKLSRRVSFLLIKDLITAENLPNGRVVDVGCGSNALNVAIAEHAFETGLSLNKIVGTDIGDRATWWKDKKVIYYAQPTTTKLPPNIKDASVDIVFLKWSMHHMTIDEIKAITAEVNRILRPGGKVVVIETLMGAWPKLRSEFLRQAKDPIMWPKGPWVKKRREITKVFLRLSLEEQKQVLSLEDFYGHWLEAKRTFMPYPFNYLPTDEIGTFFKDLGLAEVAQDRRIFGFAPLIRMGPPTVRLVYQKPVAVGARFSQSITIESIHQINNTCRVVAKLTLPGSIEPRHLRVHLLKSRVDVWGGAWKRDEIIDSPMNYQGRFVLNPDGTHSYWFESEIPVLTGLNEFTAKMLLPGQAQWVPANSEGDNTKLEVIAHRSSLWNVRMIIRHRSLDPQELADAVKDFQEVKPDAVNPETGRSLIEELRELPGEEGLTVRDLTGDVDIEYVTKGFGKYVFKATIYKHDGGKISVAIKRERYAFGFSENELKALRTIKGQGAPRYFGSFRSVDGHCWFMEEFVQGRTGGEIYKDNRASPSQRKACVRAILQVMKALSGSVPRDFGHRDNLIIGDEAEAPAKVVDFGNHLLNVMGEKASSEDQLLFLFGLIGRYGYFRGEDTNYFIFDIIIEIFGREAGLQYLRRVYAYASYLGDREIARSVLARTGRDFYWEADFARQLKDSPRFPHYFLSALEAYLENASLLGSSEAARGFLERRLNDIVEVGHTPVLASDMDDTLIPVGLRAHDEPINRVIRWVEAGGIFVLDTLADKQIVYRKVLDRLVHRLNQEDKLFLLERIPLVLGEAEKGGREVYLYSSEAGAYRLIYKAKSGDKEKGLNQLLRHLGPRAELLAYYGDRFDDPDNDGSFLGKQSVQILINVGRFVFPRQMTGQRLFNAFSGGPAATLNDIDFLTGLLLREFPHRRPDSPTTSRRKADSVLWTFAEAAKPLAVPDSRPIKVSIPHTEAQAAGFIWAGKQVADGKWDRERIYLVPLLRLSGASEAILPQGTNVFTFFWTGGEDAVSDQSPGHWEGREFYINYVGGDAGGARLARTEDLGEEIGHLTYTKSRLIRALNNKPTDNANHDWSGWKQPILTWLRGQAFASSREIISRIEKLQTGEEVSTYIQDLAFKVNTILAIVIENAMDSYLLEQRSASEDKVPLNIRIYYREEGESLVITAVANGAIYRKSDKLTLEKRSSPDQFGGAGEGLEHITLFCRQIGGAVYALYNRADLLKDTDGSVFEMRINKSVIKDFLKKGANPPYFGARLAEANTLKSIHRIKRMLFSGKDPRFAKALFESPLSPLNEKERTLLRFYLQIERSLGSTPLSLGDIAARTGLFNNRAMAHLVLKAAVRKAKIFYKSRLWDTEYIAQAYVVSSHKTAYRGPDQSVSNLALSTKFKNLLMKRGILTLCQLLSLTNRELRMKGFKILAPLESIRKKYDPASLDVLLGGRKIKERLQSRGIFTLSQLKEALNAGHLNEMRGYPLRMLTRFVERQTQAPTNEGGRLSEISLSGNSGEVDFRVFSFEETDSRFKRYFRQDRIPHYWAKWIYYIVHHRSIDGFNTVRLFSGNSEFKLTDSDMTLLYARLSDSQQEMALISSPYWLDDFLGTFTADDSASSSIRLEGEAEFGNLRAALLGSLGRSETNCVVLWKGRTPDTYGTQMKIDDFRSIDLGPEQIHAEPYDGARILLRTLPDNQYKIVVSGDDGYINQEIDLPEDQILTLILNGDLLRFRLSDSILTIGAQAPANHLYIYYQFRRQGARLPKNLAGTDTLKDLGAATLSPPAIRGARLALEPGQIFHPRRPLQSFTFAELHELFPPGINKPHNQRASQWALLIGEMLLRDSKTGWNQAMVDAVSKAASVHDFGGWHEPAERMSALKELCDGLINKYGTPFGIAPSMSAKKSIPLIKRFVEDHRDFRVASPQGSDEEFADVLAEIICELAEKNGNPQSSQTRKYLASHFNHEQTGVYLLGSQGIALTPVEKFLIANHFHYPADPMDFEIAARDSGFTKEQVRKMLDLLIFCDVWENGNNYERLNGLRKHTFPGGVVYQPLKTTFEVFEKFYGQKILYREALEVMRRCLIERDPRVLDILRISRQAETTNAFREDEEISALEIKSVVQGARLAAVKDAAKTPLSIAEALLKLEHLSLGASSSTTHLIKGERKKGQLLLKGLNQVISEIPKGYTRLRTELKLLNRRVIKDSETYGYVTRGTLYVVREKLRVLGRWRFIEVDAVKFARLFRGIKELLNRTEVALDALDQDLNEGLARHSLIGLPPEYREEERLKAIRLLTPIILGHLDYFIEHSLPSFHSDNRKRLQSVTTRLADWYKDPGRYPDNYLKEQSDIIHTVLEPATLSHLPDFDKTLLILSRLRLLLILQERPVVRESKGPQAPIQLELNLDLKPEGARLTRNTQINSAIKMAEEAEQGVERFRDTYGTATSIDIIKTGERLRLELTPQVILMIAKAYISNPRLFRGQYLIPYNLSRSNTAVKVEEVRGTVLINFYTIDEDSGEEEKIAAYPLATAILKEAQEAIHQAPRRDTLLKKAAPALLACGENQRLFRLAQKAYTLGEGAVLIKIAVGKNSSRQEIMAQIRNVLAFLDERGDRQVFIELVSASGRTVYQRFYDQDKTPPSNCKTIYLGGPNRAVLAHAKRYGHGFMGLESAKVAGAASGESRGIIPYASAVIAAVMIERNELLSGDDKLTNLLNNIVGNEFRLSQEKEKIYRSFRMVEKIDLGHYLKYKIKVIARLNLDQLLEYTQLLSRTVGSSA